MAISSSKTYGDLSWEGGEWVIRNLEPHVAIRLKALFPKIRKSETKVFRLNADGATAADLDWFLQRYDCRYSIRDGAKLRNEALEHYARQNEMEAILSGEYVPPKYAGWTGTIKPRHYQSQAAQVLALSEGLLLGDEVGLGKAQPLTEPVLTPAGWKTIGDLKAGDLVIGCNGKPCRVTGIYPRGEREVFRISSNDGSSTLACGEHLWEVNTTARKHRGAPGKVMSTAQMLKKYLNPNGTAKYYLPMVNPVEYEEKIQPLPPYSMGVLIGDGSLTVRNISFCKGDLELAELVQENLPEWTVKRTLEERVPTWRIANNSQGISSMGEIFRKLRMNVKSIYRFIPECYLRGSVEQRWELLKGLLDTDSYVKDSLIEYSTSSGQLALDIVDLVNGLSGLAYVAERTTASGRPGWRLNLSFGRGISPFKRRCKHEAFIPKTKYEPTRPIVKIESAGTAPCACIKVDGPRELYVTKDHIVTHNTISGIESCFLPGALPAVVVCSPHLQDQWERVILANTNLTVCKIATTKPHQIEPADVTIFRYTQLSRWVDWFEKLGFNLVIYDEVQDLRTGTKTEKGFGASKLSATAKYCLGLTATPIYNYGTEIWNIMQFLKPDALGPWDTFVREYAGGGDRLHNPAALGSYLREQHVFLRRTKKDVGQQVPPVIKIIEEVDYDHEVVRDAEKLAKMLALRAATGSFMERGEAVRELDVMMRKQTGIAKAYMIAVFVRVLVESGVPVLLAGWHREVYGIWLDRLADLKPVMYTGSESPKQKAESARAFIAGETDLMIISLRSGVGLDGLQARCSNCVIGELDWSPGVHHQLVGRLDREGQTEPVTVFYTVVNEGSDPPMMEVLGLKASEAAHVVDGGIGVVSVSSDGSHLQRLVERYLDKEAARKIREAQAAEKEAKRVVEVPAG